MITEHQQTIIDTILEGERGRAITEAAKILGITVPILANELAEVKASHPEVFADFKARRAAQLDTIREEWRQRRHYDGLFQHLPDLHRVVIETMLKGKYGSTYVAAQAKLKIDQSVLFEILDEIREASPEAFEKYKALRAAKLAARKAKNADPKRHYFVMKGAAAKRQKPKATAVA